MKTEFLKAMSIANGYFGERAVAHLCYDPESKSIIAVCPFGFYRTGPLADDKDEAIWMLYHHPEFAGYRRLSQMVTL